METVLSVAVIGLAFWGALAGLEYLAEPAGKAVRSWTKTAVPVQFLKSLVRVNGKLIAGPKSSCSHEYVSVSDALLSFPVAVSSKGVCAGMVKSPPPCTWCGTPFTFGQVRGAFVP